jgi:hypothetical protein
MTYSPTCETGTPRRRVHRPRPVPDLSTLPDAALLTRSQLAALSGYTEQAFKKWAREKRGPKITPVEGRPRYRADHVRAWLGFRDSVFG